MPLDEQVSRRSTSSVSSEASHDGAAVGNKHGADPEERLLQERDVEEGIAPHQEAPKSKTLKAAANMFISILGAGVLGLPYAFRQSGLTQGTILMIIIAVLNIHCMMLLVKCKKRLERSGVVTYSEVAQTVLGSWGQRIVAVLLILSQSGFCVAYLIFIAQNLASISHIKGPMFILGACPVLLALAMLRGVHALAPFSLIADAANILGILVVFYDYTSAFHRPADVIQFKPVSSLPFLFGVVIYSYEGVGMILPVEASMKHKEKFPLVLFGVMGLITVIYVSFGAAGYAAFGEHTRDIITLNLPEDWSTVAVKMSLCLGLLFTFPVMMVPVYEILERSLQSKASFTARFGARSRSLIFAAVRTSLVLLIAIVAISVPGFGLFISLVGSFACASLSFIVPSLCHLVLFKSENNWLWMAKDVFLITFGVVGAVCGSADAINEIWKKVHS